MLKAITFGLCLLLVGIGAVSAGSFQVSPVRATLSVSESVGALTVHNTGDEPTVLQLQVMSWTQADGKDIYTPTKDILATPPIFTVPANGSQVTRVGLRRAPDPQRELTYRLFLQEVPPPPKPGFQGLNVALRIGIPVFVLPQVVAQSKLHWQAVDTAEGLKINVSNQGNAHVQIANIKLSSSDNAKPLVTEQIAAYVLSGQSRSWLIESAEMLSVPGTAVHISAETDAGNLQSDVVVGKP